MDMCVDYDVLCTIEDKLKKIEYDLISSSEQMRTAILAADGFLKGEQFEKAKTVTALSIKAAERTGTNLRNAKEYIGALKREVENYGRCCYNGE